MKQTNIQISNHSLFQKYRVRVLHILLLKFFRDGLDIFWYFRVNLLITKTSNKRKIIFRQGLVVILPYLEILLEIFLGFYLHLWDEFLFDFLPRDFDKTAKQIL